MSNSTLVYFRVNPSTNVDVKSVFLLVENMSALIHIKAFYIYFHLYSHLFKVKNSLWTVADLIQFQYSQYLYSISIFY